MPTDVIINGDDIHVRGGSLDAMMRAISADGMEAANGRIVEDPGLGSSVIVMDARQWIAVLYMKNKSGKYLPLAMKVGVKE